MSEDKEVSSKEILLKKLEDLKGELISNLKPDTESTVLQSFVTNILPFPFNTALEALYHFDEKLSIEPYQWYFLLLDLKKEPNNV